jgi:hypothetical protein
MYFGEQGYLKYCTNVLIFQDVFGGDEENDKNW